MTATITIPQGGSFAFTVEYREADGTTRIPFGNLRARAAFRKRYNDEAALLELTDEPGGGLTVEPGGSLGDVLVELGAVATAALPRIVDEAKAGVFDVEMYDPGDPNMVIRLCPDATFLVKPEVVK